MFSSLTAVVGLQYGDEGKGNVVTSLIDNFGYDVVVRFNGGPNAGHTVYRNDKKIQLHQVPAGFVYDLDCIIGPECYLDKRKLIQEVNMLVDMGFNGKIYVDYRVPCIELKHVKADKNPEIQTTGQGIGPCAMELCSRKLIRSLNINHTHIKVVDTVDLMDRFLASDMCILFEGAQSILLDLIHGDYPYVSQRCMTGNILTSFGWQPEFMNMDIIGVFKPYETRSGNGPMYYYNQATAEKIRDLGNEYGVTTGRPRKIGHLNIRNLYSSIRLSGANYLVMTKIDILRKIGAWSFIDFRGWKKGQNIDNLPHILSDSLSTPIVGVSHGPHPKDIVWREK